MGQARQLFRPLALILLMTGCQCEFDKDGKFIYQPNGNDEGCNGVAHGIPCCDQEFADGDNAGDREIFIQPGQYNQSCINTCKILHPQSVGITESVRQPYFSGPGKDKNKCWCEFGRGKLKINRYQLYRTCMFKEVSNAGLSSASNVSTAAKANDPPTYLMVVTSCETSRVEIQGKETPIQKLLVNTRCAADRAQDQKMGRFTLQRETHNNKPVWKRELLLPEVYLFMSDNNHWGIGPNISENLFGILSEDRPTPELPHLAGGWRFWDGDYWIEDKSILVMAGENEDVGVDRELLMLDFKTVEVSNYSTYKEHFTKVNDSSDCCRACKSQMVTTDKGFHSRFTALFNYDKKKMQCSCFNPMRYGTYGIHGNIKNLDVEKLALTRHNSGITSGLCDTDDLKENERRAGISNFRKKHPPTYHYSDVQGLLGEGRGFYDGNTHFLGSVSLDKTMTHVNSTSCCQECRKKYPESEIFTYWEYSHYGECTCMNVKDGTRAVTKSGGQYAGICEDIGPPVDCSVSHWIPWTKCSKSCGGGIQTRYAVNYQVARRGGTQCQLEEERPCSIQDCPQDQDGAKAGSQ